MAVSIQTIKVAGVIEKKGGNFAAFVVANRLSMGVGMNITSQPPYDTRSSPPAKSCLTESVRWTLYAMDMFTYSIIIVCGTHSVHFDES